jgi:hypothetical protein
MNKGKICNLKPILIISILAISIWLSFKDGNLNINASVDGDDWLNWAKVAWRYYQPGKAVYPDTGLHYAHKDWHYFTDWDLGNYILAIIDADRLGIITEPTWTADYRIEKILQFLETRELWDNPSYQVPYLVYDAWTRLPGYKTAPDISKEPTNPSDVGRLLIALNELKHYKPGLSDRINAIVGRNNIGLIAANNTGWGSGFYRYYIAQGYKAFGFDTQPVRDSLKEMEKLAAGGFVSIYNNQSLPITHVTSEPILHGIFDLHLDSIFQDYAYRAYLVQEERFRTLGKYTAFTEGAYDNYNNIGTYYLYEWIVAGSADRLWIVEKQGGGQLNIPPVVYAKAAFGFHAVYATPYTKQLVNWLLSFPIQTDYGFLEGVQEDGRILSGVVTDKTNGMIINAARYALKVSLRDLPRPFVSGSGKINETFVIIPISDPHGPCGSAHTMDTMGGVLIATMLGTHAWNKGMVKVAMDTYSYISTYNFTTAKVTMVDTTSNLIVIGGPGVNQVSYYYNELRDASGAKVLPVLFLRDQGGDYLYVQISGSIYRIEKDAQGRVTADYAVIQIYNDDGRYALLAYGLGGEGTKAASIVLSEFEQWNLMGRAVIVKYFDSNGDGYLDTINIVETVF